MQVAIKDVMRNNCFFHIKPKCYSKNGNSSAENIVLQEELEDIVNNLVTEEEFEFLWTNMIETYNL